jgi:SAM-dependent methyltransferase
MRKTDPRSHYEAYETWKGWDQPFTCTEEQARYFAGECRDIKISGADVLEIGFGSGSFLAWAKDRNAKVAGTEINAKLLAAARTFSVELLPAEFESIASNHRERFDTIVAFDVFEHFTLDEIALRLRAVETMLRPGGNLLLRFPNAQSPFGLAPQNGDPTHKSALSCSVFEQLTQSIDLDAVRYGPSFRIVGGGLVRTIVRRARYVARDIISFLLNAIYGQQIPWDPVVVLVMRKPPRRERENV